MSVCLSDLCVCVYLSGNCYLLFILVKSGPWEQGHPSFPWVYKRERKKKWTAKGIENTVPLRAARRQNTSNRSYRCLPLGIKASVVGKTMGSSPGESKLHMLLCLSQFLLDVSKSRLMVTYYLSATCYLFFYLCLL